MLNIIVITHTQRSCFLVIALRGFIAAFIYAARGAANAVIKLFLSHFAERRRRRIPHFFLRKEFIGPVTLQGHSCI